MRKIYSSRTYRGSPGKQHHGEIVLPNMRRPCPGRIFLQHILERAMQVAIPHFSIERSMILMTRTGPAAACSRIALNPHIRTWKSWVGQIMLEGWPGPAKASQHVYSEAFYRALKQEHTYIYIYISLLMKHCQLGCLANESLGQASTF